jgi:hypothetical protein
MTLWLIIGASVAGSLVLDYAIVRFIVSQFWGPLPRSFPPQPPRDDALRRTFQSFRLGPCNFGYCVHVAVDEEHLHLEPARFLRWLGALPASVPWAAITLTGPPRRGWRKAKIARQDLMGPDWCLELAGRGDEPVQ